MLQSIDTTTGAIKEIRKFPLATDVTIYPDEDSKYGENYSFHGYLGSKIDDFAGYLGEPGLVLGSMDQEFKLKSVNLLAADNYTNATNIEKVDGTSKYFVTGDGASHTFASSLDGIWREKPVELNETNFFFGLMEKNEDFSPVIKAAENINVTIDDPDLMNQQTNHYLWTTLDNWLITGSKDGEITDPSAVKVYDSNDITNSSIIAGDKPSSLKWLNRRINRNPKTIFYGNNYLDVNQQNGIDWKALGFDLNRTGPQRVTYFIADSQMQTSTASRWVNKLDDTVISDEKHALGGTNFQVPLASVTVDLSDAESLKEKAETIAWNMGTGVIDEDGSKNQYSTKVNVDNIQLAAVQNAAEARPYPVDITYTPASGQSIVKRIWVFVTDDQTIVDEKNDRVVYTKNYSLPLYAAKKETKETIWTKADIKVYQFHSTEQGDVLLPLADKDHSNGLNVDSLDLETLQTATQAKDYSGINLTYTKDGETINSPITVTLEEYNVTLTVEFVNEANQIMTGYTVDLNNTINDLTKITYDLTMDNRITDQLTTVTSAGYEIISRPLNEAAVILDKPLVSVQYQLTGVLRLDSLPKEFDFGKLVYNAQTQRRDSPKYNGSLTVSDTRIDNSNGWYMTAELTKRMTNEDGNVLEDALRYVTEKGTEKTLGNSSQEIYSNVSGKSGTFILTDRWGTTKETEGLKLQISAGDKVYTGEYTGIITWKIIAGQP